ncbi:Uncharacterized protein OBRU01_10767 [Operophtera brumata]|uniref:Uncharacterized protein n=1 Tax=Operophtera brumata TaxID=104452 RepID=A0A0L7LDR9_OPEBR|nr:Uncharacterized protein OBRU01_10767 [Operophtera brumata]
MNFPELAVFLSSCYNIASGFYLYGHGNGLNYLFKKINETATLFNSSEVQTKWMQQPWDHFDTSETCTLQMRYFQKLDMWKPNGPIYLFIYGESRAGQEYLQAGMMYELAKETKGAMFLSEQRYYGDSKPLLNPTIENQKFLSSRHALAHNA